MWYARDRILDCFIVFESMPFHYLLIALCCHKNDSRSIVAGEMLDSTFWLCEIHCAFAIPKQFCFLPILPFNSACCTSSPISSVKRFVFASGGPTPFITSCHVRTMSEKNVTNDPKQPAIKPNINISLVRRSEAKQNKAITSGSVQMHFMRRGSFVFICASCVMPH